MCVTICREATKRTKTTWSKIPSTVPLHSLDSNQMLTVEIQSYTTPSPCPLLAVISGPRFGSLAIGTRNYVFANVPGRMKRSLQQYGFFQLLCFFRVVSIILAVPATLSYIAMGRSYVFSQRKFVSANYRGLKCVRRSSSRYCCRADPRRENARKLLLKFPKIRLYLGPTLVCKKTD